VQRLEVKALLRGGETELAHQTVQRLMDIVQKNERLEISVLRAKAVLENWDGNTKIALKLLERAKKLTEQFGLLFDASSLESTVFRCAKKTTYLH
jgi:hypothetical protein